VPRNLSKLDIRSRFDKATNAYVVEYVGRGLQFFDRPYGYSPGTFFVVRLSEIPLPDEVLAAADAGRVELETYPHRKGLITAVAEAIVTEAIVEAPSYLADIAEPIVQWTGTDLRDAERRHAVAMERVERLTRLAVADIRIRSGQTRRIEMGSLAGFDLPMPTAGSELGRRPTPLPVKTIELVVEVPAEPVSVAESEFGAPAAPLVAAPTLDAAVAEARATELPQRLPFGARRRLRKLPVGFYVATGEDLYSHPTLDLAVSEGRETAKRTGEATVIDWDGDHPVVVRRFGQNGRLAYRVEDALDREAA
jgi:hypothetical protein